MTCRSESSAEPWLVEVVEPLLSGGDVIESAYADRCARQLTADTGRDFEFDVLHDDHPAQAITGFADRTGATLIMLSTHGRTGLSRLRMGSVAADVVRHATCPVVLYRPPHLDRT